MNRPYVKGLILTACASVFVVGTAMAGILRVNNGAANTSASISYEAMGTARNITITGSNPGAAVIAAGTMAIEYELGQKLATGNLLSVSFDGLAFDGTKLNVCAQNGGGGVTNAVIATATPAEGATSFNFGIVILEAEVDGTAAGNIIWFTNDADCNGPAAANVSLQVVPTTIAGNKNMRAEIITSGAIKVDSASNTAVVTVVNEFATALNTENMVIDYLDTFKDGPGDGTRFVTGNSSNVAVAGNTSGNLVITRTATNANVSAGAGNFGLTTSAVISLNGDNIWDGVNQAYVADGTGGCVIGNNVSNVITSGFSNGVAFNVAAAAFNGSGNANLKICIEVDGTTALQSRTIAGSYDINVTGTGAQDPSFTTANIQNWDINSYQAVIPLLQKNDLVPSYCMISNSSSQAATMFFDIITAESDITATRYSLGSIASGRTDTFVFDASGATKLGESTPITSLDSVLASGAGRYAARLTVTANQNQVFVNCFQTDPNGAKRLIPVLTASGVEFKQ